MGVIALKNDVWYAEICPEYAMNVTKLTYCGEQVLRSPNTMDELAAKPVVYGTPLLIPPNVTLNDSFTFQGKEYKIPYPPATPGQRNLHGLVKNTPMRIIERSECLAVGELYCDIGKYPFPFRLEVQCILTEDGLRQKFIVENTGLSPMPFVLGLHTTFNVKSEFSVSANKVWRTNENRVPVELLELSEEHVEFTTGAYPHGRRIHYQLVDSGRHLATIDEYKYEVSPNFTNWVIWNSNGMGGFISLEPQSGPVNALNMPGQYQILTPGQREIFETFIGTR